MTSIREVPPPERGALFASPARFLGRNTAYQLGAQIFPAAALLLTVPFLVHRLGPDQYGVLALLGTAVLMFGMLDLGLSRATTRFVARSLAAADPGGAGKYFWGAAGALVLVGVIAAAALFASVPWLVHALAITPAYIRVATQALRIVCGAVPVVTVAATFRGYLEASGRFLHISLISAAGGAGNYLAPAAAVAFGGGVAAAAAAIVVVRTLACAGYFWASMVGGDRPGWPPRTTLRHLRDLGSFGGWLFVSNIIGTAMVYGDRFCLGAWVGLAAVTAYTVPMDVVVRSQVVVSAMCTVLFPLLTRLDHDGSARFGHAYRGTLAATVAVMTPLAIVGAVVAPWLMRAWLGAHCPADSVFAAQVFLAGTPVQALAAVSWSGLHARGRSDLTALVHTVEAPLYFVALFFGAIHFGVRGAAVAWLGRILLDFLLMSALLERIGRRAWRWPREMPALLISALVLAAIWLLPPLLAMAAGVVLGLSVWAWTWLGILEGADRRRVSSALANILSTHSGTASRPSDL